MSSADGASSTIFWCRRCRLHSRSPRWITLPCASAMTWISMCRGVATSRSTSSVSSPNEPRASRRADAMAAASSSGAVHLAHALAAAAGARLEQHRVADLLDGQRQRRVVQPGAVGAGHDRHPGLGHRLLGPDLVAHRLDRRGRRADEGDPGVRAGRGERGVLASGSRSRGGWPAPRWPGRRRSPPGSTGSSARPRPARSAPPRRPPRRAAPPRRRRSTRPPSAPPAGAACAAPAPRSPRGWPPAPCQTRAPPPLALPGRTALSPHRS